MTEFWENIHEYDNEYAVSNFGRIWSNKSNHLMSPRKRRDGYFDVTLCKNGKHKQELVHRLVALAFIPNPNFKTNIQINHKNFDRGNNCVDNLEWCTPAYNTHYSNHEMCKKPVIQIDLTGGAVRRFPSQREAARITGISPSDISRCARGNRICAGNYAWKFVIGGD